MQYLLFVNDGSFYYTWQEILLPEDLWNTKYLRDYIEGYFESRTQSDWI